ncbi:hypothetical protein [Pinirhizobacter sp.]|jgi:hypothetical protein|uniref:hypothetical protein n=1 Tax=Pinirhizobacter sp. TaxID=2950432 RepID=UPI002F3F1F8E
MNVWTCIIAGKRKKSRSMSVLVAMAFAEAFTRLATVQTASLAGMRRPYPLH